MNKLEVFDLLDKLKEEIEKNKDNNAKVIELQKQMVDLMLNLLEKAKENK